MTQAYTHNFSEVHQLGDYLQPASRAIGTYNTAWISVQNHQRGVFLLLTGAVGAGSTIDFALQQATDIAGTGAKAFTPAKAITQLTQAGSDSDKQVVVHVDAAELGDGYRYCRGRLTVGTATSDAAVVAIADHCRYKPTTDYDLSSVDEIVT